MRRNPGVFSRKTNACCELLFELFQPSSEPIQKAIEGFCEEQQDFRFVQVANYSVRGAGLAKRQDKEIRPVRPLNPEICKDRLRQHIGETKRNGEGDVEREVQRG